MYLASPKVPESSANSSEEESYTKGLSLVYMSIIYKFPQTLTALLHHACVTHITPLSVSQGQCIKYNESDCLDIKHNWTLGLQDSGLRDNC